MKKIFSLFIAFSVLFVLGFASNALADGDEVTSGSLTIGGTAGATTNPQLIIGLSPKVTGAYFTDGIDVSTAQWFTIGTAHPGGSKMYGTAQNLTNTYFKDYTTGTTIDKALFNLPAVKDSANDWSTGWEL